VISLILEDSSVETIKHLKRIRFFQVKINYLIFWKKLKLR